MTEGKWGRSGLCKSKRVRGGGQHKAESVTQRKNIRVRHTKHQKSFRHSRNVKSCATFQASPTEPTAAPPL